MNVRMSSIEMVVTAWRGWQYACELQVYVFDNRGQGISTDADPAPLTIDSMAASTVDLITALGLGKPDIWGTSMGGAITLTILAEHPGAVRRAVSVAGFPGGNATNAPQVPLSQIYVHNHMWSSHQFIRALSTWVL